MVEEQLISVAVEEDIVVNLTNSNPYIEVAKNIVECFFQSLEVVNTTFVRKGQKTPTPHMSKVIKMGVKQIIGKGV